VESGVDKKLTAFGLDVEFGWPEDGGRDTHYLDKGGDIWRVQAEGLPQPLGVIDGSYERIILFRQLEFKNAFIEWVILDDIKHRKAASTRLRRAFRIANKQAADSLPAKNTIAG
jgi:hypothetical protein